MRFFHVNRKKLKCTRCKAPMETAQAINGGPSDFWVRCTTPSCHTYYNLAIPMPHQALALRDPAPRVGFFGGYGSGKTFMGYQSDQKHVMLTPGGETLIGADTLVQLENTIRKDLEGDFPLDFVKKYNRQKNLINFVNGHILYYRHLADQGDIRSYDLTRAHVLEASEVKHESYIQLQTRLRNDAAIRYEHDEDGSPIMVESPKTGQLKKKEKMNWIQLVTESNPDSGWIKEDHLMKSGRIYVHQADKTNKQKYHVNPNEASNITSSHIIPSKANIYLPEDFIPSLEKGKPNWWIRRYLYGSFDYSEGMVYPHFNDAIIPSFEIPDDLERVIGMDYGLNDNTHFVFGALDWHGVYNRGRPAVYFFKEIVINNASISQIAEAYKQGIRAHVPKNKLYRTPVMDGRSYSQRTRTGEKKTIGTLFQQEGCNFKPAQMDLDARIMRLNDLIDSGMAYFFEDGVPHLIEEAKKYRYQERKLQRDNKADKPVDKENHGINATEFIGMELPYKLQKSNQGIYSPETRPPRRKVKKSQRDEWDPFSTEDGSDDQFEGFASVFHEGGF